MVFFLIFKNNFEFKKINLINCRLNQNILKYYIRNSVLNMYIK